MKRTLITLLIIVTVLVLSSVGFMILRLDKQESAEPVEDAFGTEERFSTEQDVSPMKLKEDSTPSQSTIEKDSVVVEDFSRQIKNVDQISLGGTVMTSEYALQFWWDDDKGGEALLRRDSVGGDWVLISLGGGSWGVDSLIEMGVSENIARELIKKRQY